MQPALAARTARWAGCAVARAGRRQPRARGGDAGTGRDRRPCRTCRLRCGPVRRDRAVRTLASRPRAGSGRSNDHEVDRVSGREPAAAGRDRTRLPRPARRQRPNQGPGRPPGDRRRGPARGHRPEDRQDDKRVERRDHRTSAARCISGRGRGRRVPGFRRRVGWRGAGAARHDRSDREGADAATGVRGGRPAVGKEDRTRDRQDDGCVHVPRGREQEVPQLPGSTVVPGVRPRTSGDRRDAGPGTDGGAA